MAVKKMHLIYKSLSENSATNIFIFFVVLKYIGKCLDPNRVLKEFFTWRLYHNIYSSFQI